MTERSKTVIVVIGSNNRWKAVVETAGRRYKAFVQKGIIEGKRDDLTGGGLIRSAGGWSAVKALRKANALQKGDERILGDGDFMDIKFRKSVLISNR